LGKSTLKINSDTLLLYGAEKVIDPTEEEMTLG
jgi:hypothetical protein